MEIPFFSRDFSLAQGPQTARIAPAACRLDTGQSHCRTPFDQGVGGRGQAKGKKPVVVEQPDLKRSKSKTDETQLALEQSGSRQNQIRAEPQFLGKQPRSRWNLSESKRSSEKQPGSSGESGQSVNRAHK